MTEPIHYDSGLYEYGELCEALYDIHKELESIKVTLDAMQRRQNGEAKSYSIDWGHSESVTKTQYDWSKED